MSDAPMPPPAVSSDYRAGWNAGIDRAMQILHERCATTFDPMLKRAKLAAACQANVQAIGETKLQVYDPMSDTFKEQAR